MSLPLRASALVALVAGAAGHGMIISPKSRNANDAALLGATACNNYVDYKLNPPYTNKSVGYRETGSGQPCLWFSQGCTIGDLALSSASTPSSLACMLTILCEQDASTASPPRIPQRLWGTKTASRAHVCVDRCAFFIGFSHKKVPLSFYHRVFRSPIKFLPDVQGKKKHRY
eukprot:SAG11_NODE_561_length_8524_cov_17.539466_1_plen_172_part_00